MQKLKQKDKDSYLNLNYKKFEGVYHYDKPDNP